MVIHNLCRQFPLIVRSSVLLNIFLVIISDNLLLFNCFKPLDENSVGLRSKLQISQRLNPQGIQTQQHLQIDLTRFIPFFDQINEVFLQSLFRIGIESSSGLHH